MGKALFWIAIFIGALVVTRILARKAAQRRFGDENAQSPASAQTASLKTTEKMVRCDHCGIHLPFSEATVTEQGAWCSLEHAKIGAKQHV